MCSCVKLFCFQNVVNCAISSNAFDFYESKFEAQKESFFALHEKKIFVVVFKSGLL